jgi:hypothetical protein
MLHFELYLRNKVLLITNNLYGGTLLALFTVLEMKKLNTREETGDTTYSEQKQKYTGAASMFFRERPS